MKKDFTSPSTGNPCTAAQYIAEICVKRKHGTLPYKFWNIKPYKNDYRYAVTTASDLLFLYNVKAVINALEALPWVWSLKTPKLLDQIYLEQQALSKQVIKAPELPPESTQQTFSVSRPKNKKTLLGLLNGEESTQGRITGTDQS